MHILEGFLAFNNTLIRIKAELAAGTCTPWKLWITTNPQQLPVGLIWQLRTPLLERIALCKIDHITLVLKKNQSRTEPVAHLKNGKTRINVTKKTRSYNAKKSKFFLPSTWLDLKSPTIANQNPDTRQPGLPAANNIIVLGEDKSCRRSLSTT